MKHLLCWRQVTRTPIIYNTADDNPLCVVRVNKNPLYRIGFHKPLYSNSSSKIKDLFLTLLRINLSIPDKSDSG